MNRAVLVLMWMNRHYNHQEWCTRVAEKHANIAERSATTRSRTASESISWYVTNLSWWFATDYCTDINKDYIHRTTTRTKIWPTTFKYFRRQTPYPDPNWWLEPPLWPFIRLANATFHLLTLKHRCAMSPVARTAFRPTGTSATSVSRLMGNHAWNWPREITTVISDLCGHRECRWCGSSYTPSIHQVWSG